MAKKNAYVILITLACCLLIGLGFGIGRLGDRSAFKQIVQASQQGETLAGVLKATPLSERQRSEITSAYASAPADLAGISWAVPTQLTPFVVTAPAPGIHGNARINAHQMRSSHDLASPKSAGVYRVFLTGGSTAYGSGAPRQEDIVGEALERVLNQAHQAGGPRFEVFTFASPAWASSQERIAIDIYLSELEPDLIVSFSGNNDVFWGDAGRNILWFSTFSDDYFHALASLAQTAGGGPTVEPLIAARAQGQRVAPTLVAERLRKNVLLGATALAEKKVGWIYFLQPNLASTKKDLSAREAEFLTNSKAYYVDSYAAISAALKTLALSNFSYVDLSGLFDGYAATDEVFLDQFHFGDKGNRTIAEAMARQILDRL